MTDESTRWSRVRALFEDALDRSPDARASFLDDACKGDTDLRRDVEELLAADDAAVRSEAGRGFLSESAAAIAGHLLDSLDEDPELSHYRIIERLGEGGMGVVYEAEQEEPRRRVAIKLVREGLVGDERRRRLFQREIEALARLQHPGIAAIHAAGRTDAGQHFFVMELVRGAALDAFVASRPSPRDRTERSTRLALFLDVCDAIRYAHQRGVIHRDLKPSNLVVLPKESSGSGPRIKVLDFGLARFTDIDGGITQTRTIEGTVRYMSPEQARGHTDIDTRTDVYSLGVILYELLTGSPPYEVIGRPVPEALRTVMDVPPRSPSSVAPWLRGDLEVILQVAMAKEPAERYQSVGELAEDIRRYMANLPVLARPPGVWYQLRKLAARHRVAATLTAALVLALGAGVVGTSLGMLRARRAETAARASAKDAQEQAATAERVSSFMEGLFTVSDPGESRGNTITARELLDRGVSDIRDELTDEPAVRARLLSVMGRVYHRLGLFEDARPLLEEALTLRRGLGGADDLGVASAEYELAGLLRRLGDLDAARDLYAGALATRERVLGSESTVVAASMTGLANLHLVRGRFDEARPLYERAIGIVETVKGPDADELADHFYNLGILLLQTGDFEAARPVLERVTVAEERALGADHPNVAADLHLQGYVETHLGNPDGALALHERALAIREKALGPEHADVAETLNAIGGTHREAGRPGEARPFFERALAIYERVFGPDHVTAAQTAQNLAVTLVELGQIEEGGALLARSHETIRRDIGEDHPGYAVTCDYFGRYHHARGDLASAREWHERSLAISDATIDPSHPRAVRTHWALATVTADQGDDGAASEHFRVATDIVTGWSTIAPHWAVLFDDYAAYREGRGEDAAAVRGVAERIRGE